MKKSNIKKTIENHPVIFFLGVLLAGFLSGLGTYKTILEIAKLDVVSKFELSRIQNDNIKLKSENNKLKNTIDKYQKLIKQKDKDCSELNKKHKVRSDKLSSNTSDKNVKYINTYLYLPAYMVNPEIYVDGKPAKIVANNKIIVTIKIPLKKSATKILIKKDERKCEITRLIDSNDIKLYPCNG